MSELRKQLSDELFHPLTKAEALQLAQVVTNASNTAELRNDAKNRLVCGNARWIFKTILNTRREGVLGLNDQETALFNSVVADIQREMSKLAHFVVSSQNSFTTLVTKVVTRRLHDKIRRESANKRTKPDQVGLEYVDGANDTDRLEQFELIELVKNSLEILTEEEYVIVTSIFGLDEFEVLTQGQLAEALGMPVNRVQYLFARAKRKLRATIET